MTRHFLALGALATVLALGFAPAASASTLAGADFRPGQTIGAGVAGLSYDYAFPKVDLGASLSSSNLASPASGRMLLGVRGLARFLEQPELSAAAIAGVQFDPGLVGGRSYLVPDVGLGVAYRFVLATFPLAVRFNVTLTLDQGQNAANVPYAVPSIDPSVTQPQGNLFQRLTLGPNTMVSLAYRPTENMELTLGGGTLIGVRFSY